MKCGYRADGCASIGMRGAFDRAVFSSECAPGCAAVGVTAIAIVVTLNSRIIASVTF
jgi:hypothetical protein